MGYRPPPTNIRLEWAEDHRMHGFEVMARGLRLGAMLDLAALYVDSGLGGKESGEDLTAQDLEMMKAMFRLLVGNDDQTPIGSPNYKQGLIIEWNRDGDDGQPLPISMTGIRELELWEFQGIMDGYLQAGGVKLDDPLSEDSGNGSQFPAPTALMELESLSRLS